MALFAGPTPSQERRRVPSPSPAEPSSPAGALGRLLAQPLLHRGGGTSRWLWVSQQTHAGHWACALLLWDLPFPLIGQPKYTVSPGLLTSEFLPGFQENVSLGALLQARAPLWLGSGALDRHLNGDSANYFLEPDTGSFIPLSLSFPFYNMGIRRRGPSSELCCETWLRRYQSWALWFRSPSGAWRWPSVVVSHSQAPRGRPGRGNRLWGQC